MIKTKVGKLCLASAMAFTTCVPFAATPIYAKDESSFKGVLASVDSVTVGKDKNIVDISFNGGKVKGRITFLEDGIFRYNVDPSGEFSEYATPRSQSHKATIQAQSDDSNVYSKPEAKITDDGSAYKISAGGATIVLDKNTAEMSIVNEANETVLDESAPLSIGNQTVQQLEQKSDEYFFGGGTQNGRFTHKGKTINIANESGWTDGGVASPNPFYWSTNGYGVLRNTFAQGSYNFGNGISNVATTHNENEFDAYYFVTSGKEKSVAETAETVLNEYYDVTGNPALLPEYAFYLAHLNCYNRDGWTAESDKGWTLEDGKKYQELGQAEGYVIPEGTYAESLNNEGPTVDKDKFKGVINEDTQKYSAQAVIDGHIKYDMPLGWFLPNDGYGCGYGQNGYYQKREAGEGTERMTAAIDANVANLKKFTDYAEARGVRTGLWTQAALTPEDSEKDSHYQGFQTLRDFKKEVKNGGVSALKTDVAWVGQGYSMSLNSVKDGYDILSTSGKRPALVSLDGWAGFQRYASVWTGDQEGGNWEYIRFHIPTYIGQSLSGNPNIGSDVDGIFGGSSLITTRDLQFKTFTQTMLDMDGWGAKPKKPYNNGDPYTSINRMYLKLKAQLMPYLYTYAHESVDGLPMIRAMFLEEANAHTFSTATQYQFMYGDNFLVAPVYQDTAMKENGDDIRNNIYLPSTADTWIDYFTGEQYKGGQVINNFDAPLWKLPLFVKNGSIIPMYEENNNPMTITEDNPKGLDKTRRIVEFYPYEESSFDLIEDDGISLDLANGSRNYGGQVKTHITSVVDGDKATLTIGKSNGNYNGYNSNRHTTFVVNVSKEPSSLEAKNGASKVSLEKAKDYADFEARAKKNEAVYFYDESPNLNKYSMDGEEFKNTKITTTPKLYVSLPKTDVNQNEQVLVVNGFENDSEALHMKDELNEKLAVPTLKFDEEKKTPTSILAEWTTVPEATSYEMMIDGVLYAVGDEKTTSYNHVDLAYNSAHTYKIRSRNKDGYSAWSEEQTTSSLQDPWRNVPDVEVTWNGGDAWGALKNATDHNLSTIFHSTNGDAVSKAEPLIMDLGAGYQLDKFVYTPRGTGQSGDGPVGVSSNGTVSQMDVYISLDGKNWEKVHDGASNPWTYQKDAEVKDSQKEVSLEGKSARYVKLIATKSVGGFFAANELSVYKKDGTSPFAIGSISAQGRDEVTESDYQNLMTYKGLSTKDNPTFANQVQNYSMDINMNGVYDVYDYTYTMFNLNGGTKKEGSVSGNALLLPSATSVNAGDTFTIDVYAEDVKNLNAIGQVINYDPSKLEFQKAEQSALIAQMEDLTVNKTYDSDNTAYVNLAYVNRGNKPVYEGSGILATITMKAKTNLTNVAEAIELNKVTLIGPNHNEVVTNTDETPEIPDVPVETTKEYTLNDFNITMTNDVLTTDDGTNVNKILQAGGYDALFNGTNGREFEFKWSAQSADAEKLPAYVKVPTTMHFEFKKPSSLTNFVVRNSDNATANSNGYLTSVKATITFADDKVEPKVITFDKPQDAYEFVTGSNELVKKVDIEFLSSSGTAQYDDPQKNRMLTLGEIDFNLVTGVPVEGIKPADSNAKEIFVGYLSDVKAVITPEECPNKFFTVTSSNPEVASIVTLADKNGNPIYKVRGVSEGDATITLTSAADKTKTASYVVRVVKGADKKELAQLIEDYKNLAADNYTAESYAKFEKALAEALKVNSDVDATRAEVDNATVALRNAVMSLETKPVDEGKLLSGYIESADALYSESNTADKMFDGDLSTYWESPYSGSNVGLPKDVVVKLNKTYTLEQLTFISHTARNGGVTNYRISVSMDGQNWTNVTSGLVDYDAYLKNENVTVNARFAPVNANYVKLTVLEAVGRVQSEDNQYARIAEMKLYGEVPSEPVDTSSLEQLVNKYKDTEQGNYTDESWAAFQNALFEANAVLEKENPTQDEVDTAYANLKNAIEGLTDKENPDKPVDPDNPTGPIQPVDPENPGNQSGGSKDETNTGDVTNLANIFILLLLSGAGLVLLRKKSRQ